MLEPEQRRAYVRQVDGAMVTREDASGLALRLGTDVDRVATESFAFKYRDLDDEPVDLLVSFSRGRLSWIDRWRNDGGDPLIDFPAPAHVESIE